MKDIITQTFSDLLAHRRLFVALVVTVLLALAVAIYVIVTVEASDLRVITEYSAYGVTHFYRDSWTYLLSFVGAALVSAVFAVGICLKLLRQEREPLAFLFSWLSVGLLCFILLTYIHISQVV